MNKTSGKLAAGVRKVKTQQKAPDTDNKTRASQADAPPRNVAEPARHDIAQHPPRVWPD